MYKYRMDLFFQGAVPIKSLYVTSRIEVSKEVLCTIQAMKHGPQFFACVIDIRVYLITEIEVK